MDTWLWNKMLCLEQEGFFGVDFCGSLCVIERRLCILACMSQCMRGLYSLLWRSNASFFLSVCLSEAHTVLCYTGICLYPIHYFPFFSFLLFTFWQRNHQFASFIWCRTSVTRYSLLPRPVSSLSHDIFSPRSSDQLSLFAVSLQYFVILFFTFQYTIRFLSLVPSDTFRYTDSEYEQRWPYKTCGRVESLQGVGQGTPALV